MTKYNATRSLVTALAMIVSLAGGMNTHAGVKKLGLGAQGGSTGIGGHITYDVADWLYLKAEFAEFSDNGTDEIDNVNYERDIDLSSGGLALNFKPFSAAPFVGGLKLSLGAYSVDNAIAIEASAPGEVILIGDAPAYTLQAGDTLNGEAAFESSFAPYFGVGWDWSIAFFTLSLDAGVLSTGKPEVTLTPNSALLENSDILLAEFDREIQAIEDDLDSFQYYPVLKLGFTLRF